MTRETITSIENRIKSGLSERFIGSVCVHYDEYTDTLFISFEPEAFTQRNASYVALAYVKDFDSQVKNGIRLSYLLDMIQEQIERKMYSDFFKIH